MESIQPYLVLLSLLILITVLIKDWLRPPVAFAGLLCGHYLLGWIDTKGMLAGFVNPSMISLLVLLLAALSLERTFLMQALTGALFKKTSLAQTQFRIVLSTILCSAFLNNTVVVASFLGTIRKNKWFSPSKLLIPLSFASIMGGTLTLIGTSTNLIVNGLGESKGFKGFEVLDFFWVGGPIALVGGVYLILFSGILLKERVQPEDETENEEEHYLLECKVNPESKLIGKSIRENRFRKMDQLFLVEIIRGSRLISPVRPDEIIVGNDRLLFSGAIDKIQELNHFHGLEIMTDSTPLEQENLVEVILAPYATVVGETIRDANFRSLFASAVVAVRRAGERISGKLGDVRLQAGDELVLAVGDDFQNRGNIRKNFYFSGTVNPQPVLTRGKSWFAILSFIGGLILSMSGVMPLLKAMLLVLGAHLAFKVLSVGDIRRNARYDLFIMIGSALGIARVLVDSGAADLITQGLYEMTAEHGPKAVLSAIFLLTVLFNVMVTNNAAAALAFPFAYSAAHSLDVSLAPFLMTVAFGASASFLSPYAYQTNLMVFSAGKYKFTDYIKVGLPLIVLYFFIVIWLVPVFFPF